MKESVSKKESSHLGRTNEKPISLAPLEFEEVIQDVLKIKPEPKSDKPSRKASKSDRK